MKIEDFRPIRSQDSAPIKFDWPLTQESDWIIWTNQKITLIIFWLVKNGKDWNPAIPLVKRIFLVPDHIWPKTIKGQPALTHVIRNYVLLLVVPPLCLWWVTHSDESAQAQNSSRATTTLVSHPPHSTNKKARSDRPISWLLLICDMRNQWLSSTAVTPVHLPLECLDSLSKYFLRFVYHCVRSSNDKHSQESLLSVANCMRRCNYFLGKSNYLCFPQMKYAYWVLLAIALYHICVYSDSETWWQHDFQRYMKKQKQKKNWWNELLIH